MKFFHLEAGVMEFMAQHMLSTYENLGWIPCTKRKEKKRKNMNSFMV
jgi:hypothetical protein